MSQEAADAGSITGNESFDTAKVMQCAWHLGLGCQAAWGLLTQLTGSCTVSAQPDSCKAHVSAMLPCCPDKDVHGRSSRGCQSPEVKILGLHAENLTRLGSQDAPLRGLIH